MTLDRWWAGRRTGWTAVLVAVAAVAGFTSAAQAQQDAFAPPISTEELERSLGRYVRVPPEEMARVHAAHDRYLEEYRRLQDDELEPFSAQKPPIMKGDDMAPWMRKYSMLRSRTMALDAALVSEIAQVVDEAQRPNVERIRWVREADSLRRGALGDMGRQFGSGGRADLADILFSSNLSEESMRKIDPYLRDHQSRFVTSVRKVSDESERLLMEFFDGIKAMGIDIEGAEQNPEKAIEMQKKIMPLMRQTFGGIFEANAKIAEVNRRSFREIRDQLSMRERYKVYPRWLEEAAPSLAGQFPKHLVDFNERIQSMPEVNDDARAAVDRIVSDAMQRMFISLEKAEAINDQNTARAVMQQFESMEGGENGDRATMQQMWEEQTRVFREEAEERQKIVNAAMESIRGVLPPEAVEKLRTSDPSAIAQMGLGTDAPPPALTPADEAAAADAEAAAAEERENVVRPWDVEVAIDNFVNELKPYSVSDLKRALGSMNASESAATMAESLHGDYLAQFTETVEPLRTAHNESRAKMYQFDEIGQRKDPGNGEEAAQLLVRMIEETKRVDGTFFDSLALALGEENAAWVKFERLGRSTSTLGRVVSRSWYYAPNSEQPVDVVMVLREADIPDAERALAVAAIVEHAPSLMTTSQKAFEVNLEASRSLERMQGEMMSTTGEDQMRVAQEYQRRMKEIQERVKAPNAARVEAQRAALDAALEKVSEARRPLVERAWREASYPTVFRDPQALFATFKKVESMSDLTDEQRSKVEKELADYREAYDIACDALMAASSTPVPEMGENNSDYWMALQARERTIERMRFERNETTARAASRLRAILTPEQVGRFRVLAPPSKTGTRSESPW